ncbi:response regulator transcription factor [Flavilitoribacter nigricans]|uniref:Helix-turn-helix transcriptional regulator n=1 Tax=Flavilitoribacter nigricans (strain ATCC 23147 / DSM 23189 / NBRC 102662 / NCIMB 1420 / SS-2) TaxID=1122177 RepID=A0A2D0NAN6_FLAN2|nr:response regulator transcription factor [Flavilitoribacter nigricans]PHN05555.1 helix-turn-helix transcriptional regulator [Flavilitoribacter nigricans DSM 23189 = NBRC 102662]
MKRIIWIYGLALALLVALLKSLEYRYYLRDLSVEFYIGLVAMLFTTLGIWMGLKLTRSRKPAGATLPSAQPPPPPRAQLDKLNISDREYEVLQLIAAGHSNQEIADLLFISLNTVKTHSSNLFGKLDVRRRTQAVQKAKEIGIIG